MKWSIAGLLVLGVVAAGCAAALVNSLRGGLIADGQSETEEDVQVVVVTKDLPAMSIIGEQALTSQTVSSTGLPPGCFTQTAGLIGRVLSVPVKKGQILTQKNFAGETPVASVLPKGMRAVSVSLPREDVIVMTPGSIVDVIVSFKIPSQTKSRREEAVAMTLLQSVEILAINGRSVLADEEKKTKKSTMKATNNPVVTLMVDSNQAKALQLAKKHGTVTLALRNPLDAQRVTTDLTHLTALSDEYSGLLAMVAGAQAPSTTPQVADDSTAQEDKVSKVRTVRTPSRSVWEVEVKRGGTVEKRVFSLPGDRQKPSTVASPVTKPQGLARQENSPSAAATSLVKKASQMEGTSK